MYYRNIIFIKVNTFKYCGKNFTFLLQIKDPLTGTFLLKYQLKGLLFFITNTFTTLSELETHFFY